MRPELLADPSGIHEARALLAEQVGKFTLERVQGGEKATFKASGKIDFFGNDDLTQLSGAGGPSFTERPLIVEFKWKAAA